MSGSVSPVSIVGVVVVLLHVSLVGKSSHKEPEADNDEDSFPDGLRNLVPHLLIKEMDLLQSPNVVFLAWSVGQAPNSKIVHVSHLSPGVLELRTLISKELVLECWLLVVS